MPVSASQIGSWLKAARKAAGLTQEGAAQEADVGLGVVTNSEHTGSMMAENFLALVTAYRAEDALVNQIREWRGEGGEPQAGQGDGAVAPSDAPDVNRPEVDPVFRKLKQEVEDHEKQGKKARAKKRRRTA